jgi:hypothetical protein
MENKCASCGMYIGDMLIQDYILHLGECFIKNQETNYNALIDRCRKLRKNYVYSGIGLTVEQLLDTIIGDE